MVEYSIREVQGLVSVEIWSRSRSASCVMDIGWFGDWSVHAQKWSYI